MSLTYPVSAHDVKKGTHLMLKAHPCKIVETKTSKTGKHGHAKCNMTGVDVLTGRKYNEVHPGHIVLAGFDCLKTEYEVTNFDKEEVQFDLLPIVDEGAVEMFSMEDPGKSEKGAEITRIFSHEDFDFDKDIYKVTTVTAPVGESQKEKLETVIHDFKIDNTEV